jgi:hypothetical protein
MTSHLSLITPGTQKRNRKTPCGVKHKSDAAGREVFSGRPRVTRLEVTNSVVLVESYPAIEPGNFLTEAHARELRTRGIRTTWVDEVDSKLPRVLASLDRDDRVMIAETRPAAVEMLGETVRKFDAGLLWWDGWWMRDVPSVPVDALRASATQGRIAGAGIDMSGLMLAATSEMHVSPLELLCIGWSADATTLTVILRALAIAHARGANARLTVCADELDDAVDPMRLAFLAEDFAVGRYVTCRNTRPRGQALSRYHGLLDLSNDEPVNSRLLEAMACGVPVLSSNPNLAPLVDGGPVPLGFRPGDARQLATRIVDLSHIGYENFQGLRARVRDDVVARHSLEVWADTVVAAMTNQTDPETPVVAIPVPALAAMAAMPAVVVVESVAWPAAVSPPRANSRRVRWNPPAHLGKVAVVAGLAVGTAVGTYALAGGTNRDTVFEPGVHARTTISTVAPTTASTPPTTGLGVAPVVPAPPPSPPPTAPPAPVATAPSATIPAASGPSAEQSPSQPAAATPAPEPAPAPDTTLTPPATAAPDPTEPAPPDTAADPTFGAGRGRGRGRDQG